MKRIIAGATGFIGQHLVQRWLKANIDLIVIGRSYKKIQQTFGNSVTAVDWTEFQERSHEILTHSQVIINLAGANISNGLWTEKRKTELLKSRLETTRMIADACAQLGANSPDLFNAGGVGVYGPQSDLSDALPPPLDEDTVIDFSTFPNFLTRIGREWEQATQAAKKQGVRVVNMRFGVVLDKNGGALPRIALPFYFYLGGTIGSGHQVFSWISLTDLMRAIEFLIAHNKMSGPVNLVAPAGISQQQLAEAISKTLNRPRCFPMPGKLLKLLLGQMAEELLLEGQHVVPKRLLAEGFEFQHPDIETALAAIFSS